MGMFFGFDRVFVSSGRQARALFPVKTSKQIKR